MSVSLDAALGCFIIFIFMIVLSVAETNIGPECRALREHYGPKSVDFCIEDEPKEVIILHSAHVAHSVLATVLETTLKYILGYSRISQKTITDSVNTAEKLLWINDKMKEYNAREAAMFLLRIWISVPLRKEVIASLASKLSQSDSVLRLAGDSGVHSSPQLYAALSSTAYNYTTCRTQNWYKYVDPEYMTHCNFISFNNSQKVIVFNKRIFHNEAWLEELKKHGANIGLDLHIENITLTHQDIRREVMRRLTEPYSFLFLDDTPWDKEPRIVAIQGFPFNKPLVEFKIISFSFEHYSTRIEETVREFSMTMSDVESVLQRNEDLGDLNEAACHWLRTNNNITKPFNYVNRVKVFVCDDDPDKNYYPAILSNLTYILNLTNEFHLDTDIILFPCPTRRSSCRDQLKTAIEGTILKMKREDQLMAALGPSCGASAAGLYAERKQLPLILYEASAGEDGLLDAVGGEARLWRAARELLQTLSWSRAALLTDHERRLRWMLAPVEHETTSIVIDELDNITAVINKLQAYDARVIVINSDWETANGILCAGAKRGMTSEAGYAWLLLIPRWPGTRLCGAHHLVLTYSYRGQTLSNPSSSSKNIRRVLLPAADNKDGRWPSAVVQVADAVATMAYGFKKLFQLQTYSCDYSRSKKSYRLFKKILNSENITNGLLEDFYFIRNRRASSFVLLYGRRDDTIETLGSWKIDDKNITKLYENFTFAFPLGVASDGMSRCLLKSGNPFRPQCHDILVMALIVGMVVFVTIIIAGLLKCRRSRAARHARLHVKPLDILATHLVERKELCLGDSLGAGTYGRVFEATWRRVPHPVAVKTCRLDAAGADLERELLREAALMASLRHANVLRLLGVVMDDGPVALVLKHMFFGDLATYLRARRTLALDDVHSEAEHVSGVALTSFALQAARALSYLAVERVMHRDVRAANCLLDSRRTLKLADFGLARRAAAADPTYHSLRRALFPVAWMAPESLRHGAWSSAADVWSFGVLLLELATLGARPYGSWSARRVLSHASAGGRPPLPAGAGPQLCSLTAMCWHRSPRRRPAAHELVSYLAEHPTAVSPCPSSSLETSDLTPDSGYDDVDWYISMHSL